MEAYINGSSCISHQNTFDENYSFAELSFLSDSNNYLAKEPNYKDFVPLNLIRRMSRIVKMGVSTSSIALKKAKVENVDAIIVGTGIGCYEDTDKFLRSLIENKEEMLTPTSFIQSTHNTVAGQIALIIKCYAYNFTYVHQNLSFETALLDGMLLLQEGAAENVLVGGIDETNASLLELFYRVGHLKNHNNTSPVWEKNKKGYINGEGAAFFSLSKQKNKHSIAKIIGLKCITNITSANNLQEITKVFLSEIGVQKVDLVLSGNCGDDKMDKNINEFNLLMKIPIAYFKNLCGEYFTASSFALWLAGEIIQNKSVPNCILNETITNTSFDNILIVNHYHNQQYSLICISKC